MRYSMKLKSRDKFGWSATFIFARNQNIKLVFQTTLNPRALDWQNIRENLSKRKFLIIFK